jgi:acylphosphatase
MVKLGGKFLIQGTVQGIFFRNFCKEAADSLNLKGYARNLDTGIVEIYAEGDKENLAKLETILKKGPPHAQIREVKIEEKKWSGEFKDFKVLKF